MIRIDDKHFETFITHDEILKEVNALGATLTQDYSGKEVVFVVVLNGAFMFASDLMKSTDLPCDITFVKVSSYEGMETTNKITESIGLSMDISGKHVVLIEDIVDTGNTVGYLKDLLEKLDPASVEICSLLFKPEAYKGSSEIKYVGFSIPDAFVVGYGLDYNGKGRNLNTIYQFKN
ncbi:MAG: hypoxanthine phosphoribosyltransferase [Bacteroidetes bacterium]|nr:MAG: hypoxanthine phosphoribosyltransferase [Bacteroidota bacterium]